MRRNVTAMDDRQGNASQALPRFSDVPLPADSIAHFRHHDQADAGDGIIAIVVDRCALEKRIEFSNNAIFVVLGLRGALALENFREPGLDRIRCRPDDVDDALDMLETKTDDEISVASAVALSAAP
jgi:hypothetical protein